jgi:hypothetical protein
VPSATQTPSTALAEAKENDERASGKASHEAASSEDADDAPSRQISASERETSDKALFGLSYATVWLVALACLILGVATLAYASILWKRDQSER